MADEHVPDYGVLPAVLPAVTGQQAVAKTALVYAVNNTGEYAVIPDHTIVACEVPVLESADLVPSLNQENVEKKDFSGLCKRGGPCPSPSTARGGGGGGQGLPRLPRPR